MIFLRQIASTELVFSCCFCLHVHTHCIAIVENVVFWTSTRTRFPSECVEILVPTILQYMLLIMYLALYFCWLACVSDMALLKISEKRVQSYFNPSLPSTLPLLDGVTPIFKVLIYDFRLWVSQHVSYTHLCSFQKTKKELSVHFHVFPSWCFWFVCHANVFTFVCNANFDRAHTWC